MRGAGAVRKAGRWGLVATMVSVAVLGGLAQPAPPALTEGAHPVANAADPLGRVRCLVLGDRVVSGPCTVVGGRLSWRTAATRRLIMRGVKQARAAEALGPLHLPAAFAAAGPAAQTLALLDAERASRGLPVMARRLPALDRLAAQAATAEDDPTPWFARGAWGSVWGKGIDAAEVWFAWMYRDGWGGSPAATENIDCVAAAAPGCWGHRGVILGDYGPQPVVGIAAIVNPGGQVSIAMIISAGAGTGPRGETSAPASGAVALTSPR